MRSALSGTTWTVEDALRRLRTVARPEGLSGMARFGINTKSALGVRVPDIRKLARDIGINHSLGHDLWRSGVHEARILASLVADTAQVTEKMMESWAKDFDSWDLCDQCCGNLFDRTQFAFKKAIEWASRDEEFVKRAAFALMASAAVHRKDWDDQPFVDFLKVIEVSSTDERNFVKKAVNWALRQIGKRNDALKSHAVEVAERLRQSTNRTERWIGRGALKELIRT